jgi:hypothetical protein
VNVFSEPGEHVVSASADPAGSFSETHTRAEIGCVEVIGYWHGEFHVVHSAQAHDLQTALTSAERTFSALPIRFLLTRGSVIRENASVTVTGTWPEAWRFARVQDLGVLSAYLFECASAAGGAEPARVFREGITPAWPMSEQPHVYLRALEFAERELVAFLPESARLALREGISTGRRWL